MTGTNLLDPYGRNETCWCGSRKKYKFCHGNHRPASAPGTPLPPDPEDGMYLSPSTVIANEAIDGLLPAGGVPFTMPQGRPAPSSISFTSWDTALGSAAADSEDVLGVEDLGGLRVQVLRALDGLPANDDPISDSVAEGVYRLTAETIRTVSTLVRAQPRPAVLWNHELDVAQFLGRTILLADHVFYPDRVFERLLREPSNLDLKRAAAEQLKYESLLAAGTAIPVPPGVALAAQGKVALEMTAEDLEVRELVEWVRAQLIVEGPTARSALLIRAIDDLTHGAPNFWLHGRIDPLSLDHDTGRFSSRLLVPYEPNFDYGPWVRQVQDEAVGKLVQRTNERLVAADVFGAEYVSVSLFEARLLRRRNPTGDRINPAQAAVWADIPELTDGVEFAVVAMGMFGFAEIILNLEQKEDRSILAGKIRGLFPTMADLKGQKLWMWGDDQLVGTMFRKLALNGVPLGVPEVDSALTSGKITACYGSPVAALRRRLEILRPPSASRRLPR